MALKKEKKIKGYKAEYWKITDLSLGLINSTMYVELGLFKDKPTRDSDPSAIMDVINFEWKSPEDFMLVANMTVLEMVGYAYSKIIKSDVREVPVLDDNGQIMYDIDGNQLTEVKETNWFSDSEAVLEI